MNDNCFCWQVAVSGVRITHTSGRKLFVLRGSRRSHTVLFKSLELTGSCSALSEVQMSHSRSSWDFMFVCLFLMTMTKPDSKAASVCLSCQFHLLKMETSKGLGEKLIKTSTPFTRSAWKPTFPWAVVEMVFIWINQFHALCSQLCWYSEWNATMTTATTDGIWSVSKLQRRYTAVLLRFAYFTLSRDPVRPEPGLKCKVFHLPASPLPSLSSCLPFVLIFLAPCLAWM